jgi:breast cancer 2 susceptibility protein
VTNLRPTQLRSWRKPDDAADIFLSTRRDTSWRLVE